MDAGDAGYLSLADHRSVVASGFVDDLAPVHRGAAPTSVQVLRKRRNLRNEKQKRTMKEWQFGADR